MNTSSSPGHDSVPASSLRGKLVALLGIALLTVIALMGYLIWSGYREAIQSAETTSRNYAATIEARLDATLRRADAHLQVLGRELPVAALSKQAVPRYARELDAMLDLLLLNFPELGGLRVFDANGDLIYTSDSKTTTRTNIVDRSHFHLLRDNPQIDLLFSETVVSRATGRQTMGIVRALRDAQGAFRGVVLGAIELEYFQKLFQSLDIGSQGVFVIYRSDNFTPVVRWPAIDANINKPLPPNSRTRAEVTRGKKTGTFENASTSDGVVRIYSFHLLEHFPFYTAVGVAREDALAGWKTRSLAVGLSALLLLILLAGLLYRLQRTESRRARTADDLARSERRHRDLMATTPGAIYEFHIDAAGRRSMPFISDGVAELTGLSAAEIMADVEVALRQVPAAAMPALEQSIRDSLENLAPWLHEFPYRTTAGTDKWLRGHSIPHREADGSTRWRGVLVDITARKRAEESRARLAAIVEHASDAIIGRALDGTITSWNAAAERLFGYTAPEAIGRPISMLRAPGLSPLRSLPYNNERLLRGEYLPLTETKRVTRDGGVIDVMSSISPIRNEAGDVIGAAVIVRDIGERKRAEQVLRESEDRYRDLVENSRDLICTHDLEGRLLSVNTAVSRALGYTRDALTGMNLGDLLTPGTRVHFPAYLAGIRRQGHAEGVMALQTAGGKIRYWEFHNTLRETGVAAPIVRGMARDITERRQAERALAVSEQRLAYALDATAEGVWDWNIRTGAVLFSDQWIATLGYSPQEVPQSVEFWKSIVHPEDLPATMAALQAHLERRTPVYECENRLRMKSGRYRYNMDRGKVVEWDADGNPLRMVGVDSDISERKTTEIALRLLSEGTAQLTGEAFFNEIANQAARLLEVEIGFVGRLLKPRNARIRTLGLCIDGQILPAVEYDLAQTPCEAVIGKKTAIFPRDIQQLFPADRMLVDLGVTGYAAVPLFDMKGLPLGHIGVMSRAPLDNPERIEALLRLFAVRVAAEVERQALEEQLRQAHKMEAIGTLAGGIAHDFNNILASIIGNTELARQDVGAGHPALESLTEIGKASARARDLVQQILTFSRKQAPVMRALTLPPVIEEAVKLIRAALPAGIHLTTVISPGAAGVGIQADPTLLQQVMINLCANAAHAMGGKLGRIDIRLERIDRDDREAQIAGLASGRYLHLSVRDTGCGMDAATLEHLFDPFFTTKAAGEGTGLGLSVVHGIMQAHEGAIRVDSRPGEGSTFHLYFPVADAAVADEKPAAELPLPATAAGRDRHVLYVDDDGALVFMLTRLLERQGYRVSGHTSARKALGVLRADPRSFDLVVTDYNMPEMSGLDLAREIHAIRPDLPVALTSGYITDELRRKSADTGLSTLIYKPNTVNELCEAVHLLTSG